VHVPGLITVSRHGTRYNSVDIPNRIDNIYSELPLNFIPHGHRLCHFSRPLPEVALRAFGSASTDNADNSASKTNFTAK
jgi:hypothetical protein